MAATRLLWALGFAADAMYPVRVVCRKCPEDPNRSGNGRRNEVVFDPAAIERKMPGHAIETHDESGWAWHELDLVDEGAGGAPRAHRDALKLLAVFLQHTDNKAVQQRILCVGHPGKDGKDGKGDEPCPHPIGMLNDVGLTFGHANLFNRNLIGSVNLKEWSHANIWLDEKRCIGDLAVSQTGTLNNPQTLVVAANSWMPWRGYPTRRSTTCSTSRASRCESSPARKPRSAAPRSTSG